MSDLKWWQAATFYQIYPRSFADGNGDGIGDLPGIISKLDYLKNLGVDAIWLSPHYPSPNWDCGYDISDYCAVAPEYGTLDDFRAFLAGAHSRGIRVILDLVLNHTSDQHPWFLESKSSRNNPKADWYIWYDEPPNNWQSCFDGSAWTYVPERGQYYYHYFMKQQPDLNWRNPAVKQAMWDAVRFWLDLGVDGFRLDAIGTIYEDPALTPHTVPMNLAELRHFAETAATPAARQLAHRYFHEMFKHQWGGPGLHDLMKELRAILDSYPGDRMLVGEDEDIAYLGNGDDELHLVFNFPLMRTDRITPAHVRRNQWERLARLDALPVRGWPCNTLGNHDSSRVFTRFGGDGRHAAELARLNAALVLTLRGTPFLYNGEEIGMTDLIITDPAQLRDTMAVWYYHSAVNDLGVDPAEAALAAGKMSRDKNRTPMQWANAANAGFCPADVKPWLPVNPNYAQGVNVADQEDDPGSLLNYYRRLIRVRRESPALVAGEYRPLHERARGYLAFLREAREQAVLVVLNYSASRRQVRFDLAGAAAGRALFSSHGRAGKVNLHALRLQPFEVLIAELQGPKSRTNSRKEQLLTGDRDILLDALKFHGHRCWASVAGVRAGLAALRTLGVKRSGGTQLYAILETGEEHAGMCFGDGVQYTTGCTFGKGNIRKKPLGKLAFTLIEKDSNRAVRVSYKPTLAKQIAASAFMQKRAAGYQADEIPEAEQWELVDLVWNAPESDVLTVGEVFTYDYNWLPEVMGFVPCQSCGELVALAYVRLVGDRKVCIPCSGYER